MGFWVPTPTSNTRPTPLAFFFFFSSFFFFFAERTDADDRAGVPGGRAEVRVGRGRREEAGAGGQARQDRRGGAVPNLAAGRKPRRLRGRSVLGSGVGRVLGFRVLAWPCLPCSLGMHARFSLSLGASAFADRLELLSASRFYFSPRGLADWLLLLFSKVFAAMPQSPNAP